MVTHVSGSPRTPRFFYGYWIVFFTFLCMLISIGCGSFIYSLFVRPLQSVLGWSRGEIMVGFTIFFIMMGVASLPAGRLVDRRGARPVIVLGAVVMGLGFIILSVMSHLYLFYLGYVLIGAGAGGIGSVPCSAVVSNWFRKKRGTAIGLMSSGIGAGGLVMAPLAGYLIEVVGWRGAYFSMALIVWVAIIPLALLTLRTRPEEMGLHPDGAAQAEQPRAYRPGSSAGLTLRQAVVFSAFWLLAMSYFFANFSSMGGIQSQGPNLTDLGFSTGAAAVALSAIGFGSGTGKFIFGWLCDKMPARYVSAIGLSLQAAGLVVILQVDSHSSMALVWTYSLLIGFGAGSWLPTVSILTSQSFGLKHYGSIFGMISLLLNIGTAIGPLVAGMMYDSMGTYHSAFVLLAAVHAISIPAVLLVRRPKSFTPDC